MSACGHERGNVESMWNSWDIEYPKDLFSLMGSIHQISVRYETIISLNLRIWKNILLCYEI